MISFFPRTAMRKRCSVNWFPLKNKTNGLPGNGGERMYDPRMDGLYITQTNLNKQ